MFALRSYNVAIVASVVAAAPVVGLATPAPAPSLQDQVKQGAPTQPPVPAKPDSKAAKVDDKAAEVDDQDDKDHAKQTDSNHDKQPAKQTDDKVPTDQDKIKEILLGFRTLLNKFDADKGLCDSEMVKDLHKKACHAVLKLDGEIQEMCKNTFIQGAERFLLSHAKGFLGKASWAKKMESGLEMVDDDVKTLCGWQ